MPCTPGHPIVQSDLQALADLAGDAGCPPSWDYEQSPPVQTWDAGGVAYRFDPYKLDPNDPNETAIRRWRTELTRLRTDVFNRAIALMAPTETTPFDPTSGVVSGPWLIPTGHPWFFDNGGTPKLAGVHVNTEGTTANFGRSALGVRLWSRGVPTPFRVFGTVAPAFDYMLDPAEDKTGYVLDNQTGGSATVSFSRPTSVAGFVRVVVQADQVDDPRDVTLDYSACDPQPSRVWEPYERIETYNETTGKWDVSAQYHLEWGNSTNEEGDRDIFDPEKGPVVESITAAWSLSGGGYTPAAYTTELTHFYFSARYGDMDGDYPATSAAAVSEDEWYVTKEEPALTVTCPFRKGGVTSGATGESWNYSNVCALYAEALPATPEAPAEARWEASLWPVPTMRRGGLLGETFPGQPEPGGMYSGGPFAVPQAAADGLWVQSAAADELEMDGTARRQTLCWNPGYDEGWRPAIDYVVLTRRKPYGNSPAVDVQVGCWRGAGEARAFVPLVTVTLPAGQAQTRVDLLSLSGFASLLPVFDGLSIGYTNADLVTVRLGNWKGIGAPSGGCTAAVGVITADGTPANLLNDLETLCLAMTPAE